jgi:hypothetical protein
MVYLVGVDHQVQHNGPPMSQARKDATLDFSTFLKAKAKELNISMLAEEFNEDALKGSQASTATVNEVAKELGLKHLFCDPTYIQRKELGIYKDNHKRECFWLSCLEDHLVCEKIIFVCGRDHLESFEAKLVEKGFRAEILPEKFGIGLPRLMYTIGGSNLLEDFE